MHVPDTREREAARRYFRPFLKYFVGRRAVLDIGSGQGHFLELLKEAGIKAVGVEVDASLCAACRQKGLEVVEADVFAYLRSLAPSTFDAAHLSHLVEHFAPREVLQLFGQLHRALSLDAVLVILTPNIANIRRAVGDFWRDPSHVRPYPVPAISRLLQATGWEVVESGEHASPSPALTRRIKYAIRNTLFGRYWCGEDVYVVARSLPGTASRASQ